MHCIFPFLNAFILLVFIAIGIAIQGALFLSQPIHYFQPDLALMIISWCALNRSFEEGGLLTLAIAYFNELHSLAPQGFFLITYMGTYLWACMIHHYFVLSSFHHYPILALVCFLFFKFLERLVFHFLDIFIPPIQSTIFHWLTGAGIQSLHAFWVFPSLKRLDWLTYKGKNSQLFSEIGLSRFSSKKSKWLS